MQLKTKLKYTSALVAAALSVTAVPTAHAGWSHDANFQHDFSNWKDIAILASKGKISNEALKRAKQNYHKAKKHKHGKHKKDNEAVYLIPYDYPEYQAALDIANLQLTDLSDCTDDDVDAYCAKSDVVAAGEYEGYSSEYFYVDEESGWLTFEMEGDSNRSELRFVNNFKTDSASTYSLTAEILPIKPLLSVSASGTGKVITLLQIHNKGENAETDSTVLSHPLVRVVWDGESRTDSLTGISYSEGYWAIIKNNAYECSDSSKDAYVADCPDSYDYYYLGDFDEDNATKFELVAGDETLIINVDDSEVVNLDISYWSHLYSYFKAGVYNQYENGNSVVQFKSLDYSENIVEAEDNQVAKITDTDTTDTGELRYKLTDAQTEGSFKVSLLAEEGGTTSAFVTLYDSANSVSSDIADLRLKSGKIYLRTAADSTFDSGISFPEGEWFDLELTWDTATDNSYSIYIDGVLAGTFAAENEFAAVQTLSVRLNSNSGVTTEALYLDNFAIYADQAASEVVYENNFDGAWSIGDSLDVAPFNSSTQEAVVALDPTLDVDTDTETDSDSDTDIATDTDTDSDSDTDSATDTDSDSDTDSATDTDSDSDTDSATDTDTDTDSDSDTDSATDTDTDSDSDTDSATDTDSDVTSDLVAQITDTDTTDTGELRYKLSEAQFEGSLKASLFYEEGGSTTAYVTLFDSANSVSSDIADIRLKGGQVYLRTEADSEFDTGFSFPEGEWFDLEVVWDTANSNTYTVYINDEEVGTFAAENTSVAVQTLAVRYNSNSSTTTETLYVDNFEIYSDQAATVLVHEDDFESWSVGDSLDTAPYNSATQEAVVVANPAPTVTNFVAKITDTDTTDTGELRYKLSEAQYEGTLKASLFYELGGSTTAYVTLFDSANSVSSDIADIRLKGGQVYLRTEADSEFDTGFSFPEGEWFDLEVVWDTATNNTYSIYINEVEVGTFVAENLSAAVQTLAIRYNSNSSTTTETLYVDNFAIYADQAATTAVYVDDFDTNWVEGDSLDTAPYNSSTQEAVVALDPILASDDDTDTATDGDTDSDATDTETDSDGDTDSDATDTDTDTDSDSDATDTDTDSDSDTDVVDPGYNQVAKITDTLDTDTGELRYKLSDAQNEGAIHVSMYYEVGGSTTAYLSLFDSANSVSSDIADIRLKSGNVYLRTEADSEFDTGVTFPEGAWFDIQVSWDTAVENTYTITIDGIEVGSFTAENLSAAVQTLAVRFNSNSGTTTETLYLDNLAIYADQAATSVVFSDDFDASWSVTDSLDTSPYNSSTAEAVVAYDPTLDIEDPDTDTDSDGADVPYDYVKYQNALDNANLQQNDLSDCTDGDINAYCSKSDVVKAGGYENYESEYFYIDDTSGWLTFEMEGDSNRTELRFVDDFLTNSADVSYTLSAEILPIDPEISVANSGDGQEMTLLQVHNKGENAETDETVLSHPLLRVVWDGESRTDDSTGISYTGAYWAIIKTNAYECSDSSHPAYLADCPDSYAYFYLADYDATNPTKFDISTGNSQLTISVDGVEAVNYDISYWAHLYSYYKAGVYNQYEDGNSVVQFKTLSYDIVTAEDEAIKDPGELEIAELNNSVAPSVNFDLSTWNLSVPIDSGASNTYAKATTITVEKLNDEYELEDYFWTDNSDGGMVFKDYVEGARTSENTTYTRTELREMLRGEDTSIATQGVNENNWVFSSVPEEQQLAAGGVDGYMKATLAVNAVTTTGKSSYVGRVIVGQIHAASDEPIRIYYRLLPGHTKGSVYFAHEPSNGNDEQWYEMIGSRSDSADEPEDGIALNEKFSYEIDVQGDLMTVTITRTDGSTVVQEVDMSDSGYSDGYYDKDGDGVDETEDYMYFKAGVYNQNKLVDEDEDGVDDNGAEADDYVQATFYYLETSHN